MDIAKDPSQSQVAELISQMNCTSNVTKNQPGSWYTRASWALENLASKTQLNNFVFTFANFCYAVLVLINVMNDTDFSLQFIYCLFH